VLNDTELLTTRGGYKVTLKKEITYGEYLDVQRSLAAGTKYDGAKQEVASIETTSMLDMIPRLYSVYVVALELPDGTKTDSPTVAVKEMPVKDGLELQTKVLSLFAENQSNITKKNTNS